MDTGKYCTWSGLSSNLQKTFIFVGISIFLIGGITGGFVFYNWPHRDMKLYLYQRIAELESTKRGLNNIKDNYSELRRILEEAEQSYLALKRENYNLHEQVKSLNQQQNDYPENYHLNDELMPGYNMCIKRAEHDFVELKNCAYDAYDYWDKKLKIVYNQVLDLCNGQNHPAECKKHIKEMETNWIFFKEKMSVYICEGGIEGAESGNNMNQVDKYLCNLFIAEETKRQCKRLEDLVSQAGY